MTETRQRLETRGYLGTVVGVICCLGVPTLQIVCMCALAKCGLRMSPLRLIPILIGTSITIFFLLRFGHACKAKHQGWSLAVTVPGLLIFLGLCVGAQGRELVSIIGISLATMWLPGFLAILLASYMDRRIQQPKGRRIAIFLVLFVLPMIYGGLESFWQIRAKVTSHLAQYPGEPALQCDAEELKRSVIVPTLDYPIRAGTNVVWCASLQLAWNELAEHAGGPVQVKDAPSGLVALNEMSVTRENVDEQTVVAQAGPFGEVRPEILKELKAKFSGRASPEFLPDANAFASEGLFAYCYLFNNMPFEWAFERSHGSMSFDGVRVEWFGISQYREDEKNEKYAGSQLVIHDYQSQTNFVIELLTRKTNHHLYVACVPPGDTLAETTTSVMSKTGKETSSIGEADTLGIPVIDFDVIKRYKSFEGVMVSSEGNKGFNLPFLQALQQIRFRLDEKGAVLKSEAVSPPSAGRSYCCNRPFLIMLTYRDSKVPYFAMWIDNAELLLKSRQSPEREP
jgi:hypothetical protein